MKPLDYPDRHFLNSALGWLDLGCVAEAKVEVERLSVLARFHPEAMLVRWRIHARAAQWQRACDVARLFTKLAPNQAGGWICLAYSLYRMQRPLEAWLQLMPQARAFPKVRAIPYLLARIASQMGHAREATKWLSKSGELGGPTKLFEGDFDAEALALLTPQKRPLGAAGKPPRPARLGSLRAT